MDKFITIVFLAIIVEGLVTYIKTFFVGGKFQWQILVAIFFGVVASIAYNIDLFESVGFVTAFPIVGQILTGILISRGSNYVFDLIGQLTAAKTAKE